MHQYLNHDRCVIIILQDVPIVLTNQTCLFLLPASRGRKGAKAPVHGSVRVSHNRSLIFARTRLVLRNPNPSYFHCWEVVPLLFPKNMAGLYYVLLKWAPDAHSSSTMLTFNILCFSSRYDADEFYRELPTVRYSGTPLFSRLSRSSPQFWTHESPRT